MAAPHPEPTSRAGTKREIFTASLVGGLNRKVALRCEAGKRVSELCRWLRSDLGASVSLLALWR